MVGTRIKTGEIWRHQCLYMLILTAPSLSWELGDWNDLVSNLSLIEAYSFIRSFIPQLPGPATWIQLAMPSHPPIRFPPERPQWLHQAVQGLDKGRHLQCCPGSVLQSWIRTGIFWQILTSSNRKDWTPTTNCNPWLQHTAQKKIGMRRWGFFFRILKLRSYQLGHQIHVPCPIWSHLWNVAFAPNCGWNARHMCNDKSLGNQWQSNEFIANLGGIRYMISLRKCANFM